MAEEAEQIKIVKEAAAAGTGEEAAAAAGEGAGKEVVAGEQVEAPGEAKARAAAEAREEATPEAAAAAEPARALIDARDAGGEPTPAAEAAIESESAAAADAAADAGLMPNGTAAVAAELAAGEHKPTAGAPAVAQEQAPAQPPARAAHSNVQALHEELMKFAEEATLTSGERKRRETAVEAVRQACDAAFPAVARKKVQPFGSFVHGVSLPGADLDLVVTGLMTPITRGGGFTSEQRELLGPMLKRLSSKLQAAQAVRKRPFIIFNARVPIIKAESSEGVRLDVCCNSDEGPKAAAWLAGQCTEFPMLRPLCLVLKALLQEQRLGDASTGGLSTWSLSSMVLALLQEQQKAQLPITNAGHLLLGFLKYFGRVFDLENQAVSVKQGGVVAKADVPYAAAASAAAAEAFRAKAVASVRAEGIIVPVPLARLAVRLCVEDPLTGRDVAGGSTRINQVRATFSDTASKLELLLKQGKPPPGGFLPFLFDVNAALRRKSGGAAAAASLPTAVECEPHRPDKRKREQEGPAANGGSPSSGGAEKRQQCEAPGGAAAHGDGARDGSGSTPHKPLHSPGGKGGLPFFGSPGYGRPAGTPGRDQVAGAPGGRLPPPRNRDLFGMPAGSTVAVRGPAGSGTRGGASWIIEPGYERQGPPGGRFKGPGPMVFDAFRRGGRGGGGRGGGPVPGPGRGRGMGMGRPGLESGEDFPAMRHSGGGGPDGYDPRRGGPPGTLAAQGSTRMAMGGGPAGGMQQAGIMQAGGGGGMLGMRGGPIQSVGQPMQSAQQLLGMQQPGLLLQGGMGRQLGPMQVQQPQQVMLQGGLMVDQQALLLAQQQMLMLQQQQQQQQTIRAQAQAQAQQHMQAQMQQDNPNNIPLRGPGGGMVGLPQQQGSMMQGGGPQQLGGMMHGGGPQQQGGMMMGGVMMPQPPLQQGGGMVQPGMGQYGGPQY